MGSSKKGGGQEVSDILMSIDYGVCYGPVDSFNQVWVKDKPIWCGRATERTDIEVNQPELFGGDGGEGGVEGTVEVYTGTDDQVSSAQLAGRVDRTIETMPGYPGLAHLFFRGNLGSKEPIRTATSLAELIANAIFGGKESVRGFKWATNNPYMPTMKTSVTRLPKSLPGTTESPTSGTSWKIFPPAVDEDGNLVDDIDGAYGNPDNLMTPPGTQTDNFPVYVRSTFPPITEEDQPWYVLSVGGVMSTEELEAAALQGWVPELIMNYDMSVTDGADPRVVQTSNYGIQVLEMAADLTTVLATHEWLSPAPTTRMTVQETIALNKDTREIRFYSWVNGGSISFISLDSTWDLSVGFTGGFIGDSANAFVYPELTAVGSFEDPNATLWDLKAMGFVDEVIDSGQVRVGTTGRFWSIKTGLGGSGSNGNSGFYYATGFGATPTGGIDYSNPIPLKDEFGVDFSSLGWSGVGLNRWKSSLQTQPGIRFVSLYCIANHSIPSFATFIAKAAFNTISGPERVEGTFHCNVDKTLGILPDANPAQIIYECMTNVTWGKGEDPAMFNDATFLAAAQTLDSEYFGLSMMWAKQDTIEKFVQEVLDHIQAFLFQCPMTGLWELRLLRDDYDIGTALHIDESNAELSGQKRKAWGETINEIVVSYTDPTTEKAVTVSSHNLGGIAMNGSVISETRDYYGIRNPILAKVVADRDVESAGYPVFTCRAEVDRTFWNTKPGDVVTLSWNDEGLSFAVMRVMGVDYGSPSDRKIVLDLSEDIYALEQTTYSGGQGSLLDEGLVAATPMDVEMVVTTPLPSLVQAGQPIEDVDAGDPAVTGLIMADSLPRPLGIDIHTEVVKGTGEAVIESVGSVTATRSALTEAALVPEVTTRLPEALVTTLLRGVEDIGSILMIGADELSSEMVMLQTYYEADEEWSVIRGLWDTVPKDWPIGSRVWAYPTGTSAADPGERAAGETRTYRLLPKTSFNTLAYADAPDLTKTFTARPFAPFRPANCHFDTKAVFEIGDYSKATTLAPLPATITVNWSNRNRGTEDAVALLWNGGEMTPEVGQTTVLRFYDIAGAYSHEITGLAGASYAIPIASFAPLEQGFIEFLSERDTVRSLWGNRLQFDLRQGGYGLSYGYDYGGVSV